MLHDQLLSQTGGLPGLRDEGLLESAPNAPFQSFGETDAYPSRRKRLDWVMGWLKITLLWTGISGSEPTQIWVTDTSEKSVDEKMTACYLEAEQAGKELFRFRPQRMSYELLYQKTFAEILCPDTVYDLVDYHLRECLKREIKMRACKNCGRLFAVTGHVGVEYCDRPFDEKGRTCKEIGAFRVWEKSKSEDEVFKVYRREYKKRFAWIRAGRITKDEFYAWSEKAREKKTECEAGNITLEEFGRWLKEI